MWTPSSCGGSPARGGDVDGVTSRRADGTRGVVSIGTRSMVPKGGVPQPTRDVAVDHTFCATH